MKAETPATGILKQGDFGDSLCYYIPCECTDPDHAHTVAVEADEHGVTVYIYSRATTKFWSMNRWRQIWQILTQGYADVDAAVIMSQQQTVNYAETLINAAKQVRIFRDNARGNKKTKN